ncbi:MAG TPA: 50S ribosomal protein L17 [Flavipsychrobacter sp.]|nr:50S ribosomal protein L17 [Flavipsychrobacter sp.]
MRHGDKIKNLGRTASHRRALMSNLACQLIEHKRITTTLTKAKSLRVYVEPLITRSKEDTMHNRRVVFGYLQDKEAIKELFGTIGDKVANRPGGYTRIIKLPRRFGDAADMGMIELVDFNEIYKTGKDESAKKTRRSRRSSSAKKEETTAAPAQAFVAETVAAPAVDDLAIIEGIGPKIAAVLNENGITTFAALAEKTAEEIKAILDAAEGNFNAADATTWSEQAKMAAEGKMDELKAWQDELKGGKEA